MFGWQRFQRFCICPSLSGCHSVAWSVQQETLSCLHKVCCMLRAACGHACGSMRVQHAAHATLHVSFICKPSFASQGLVRGKKWQRLHEGRRSTDASFAPCSPFHFAQAPFKQAIAARTRAPWCSCSTRQHASLQVQLHRHPARRRLSLLRISSAPGACASAAALTQWLQIDRGAGDS